MKLLVVVVLVAITCGLAVGQPQQDQGKMIQVLANELVQLRAIYTPNHPEVRAVERLIVQAGSVPESGRGAVDVLRAELARKLTVYREKHPDVVRLRAAIKLLEQ